MIQMSEKRPVIRYSMFLFVTLLIVVLAGGSDDASADEINARHKGHYKTSGDAWGVAVRSAAGVDDGGV